MSQAALAFSPLGTTLALTAPNASASASTTLPGSGGAACKVHNSAAVPITVAFAQVAAGAAATATSHEVAAGLTVIISMPIGTTDVSVYGIGGSGTVYLTRGDGN